ncbi:MAG: OmpA family protein [Candidatus Omnitrophica bacterium]|nr:OmpA family protein [Candidatus Omnitrophota bacterium]
MKQGLFKIVLITFLSLALAGCTFIVQKGRRSDIEKIQALNKQLDSLEQAKKILEKQLAQEINDKDVKLQMMEKGLVITFLTDIVFDPGKSQIKPEAYPALDKVAKVLKENVPDLNVGIEGYTDNQPIKFSGWKSNWELSTARALSVLHYLVDVKGIEPERVSAIGYGEYQPVASNNTKEGRRSNRRVEIVVLPQLKKVKEAQEAPSPAAAEKSETGMLEPKENLK